MKSKYSSHLRHNRPGKQFYPAESVKKEAKESNTSGTRKISFTMKTTKGTHTPHLLGRNTITYSQEQRKQVKWKETVITYHFSQTFVRL